MTPYFRTFIDRGELSSTSDLARALVESRQVELPLLVRARRQTAGRGRGDHSWWSDEGSLTFTIAIDPATHLLKREHEPRLALAVAVGIVEAIEGRYPFARADGPALVIRWPNDVEIDGRKLGGILPERVETPDGPRLLIGVGLNVGTNLRSAPGEVRAMATSLRDQGIEADAEMTLAAIVAGLPDLLARLARDEARLSQAWSDRDALRGVPIRLLLGGRVVEGIGGGIDPTGGLVLVGEDGPRVYYGGQVLREEPLPRR